MLTKDCKTVNLQDNFKLRFIMVNLMGTKMALKDVLKEADKKLARTLADQDKNGVVVKEKGGNYVNIGMNLSPDEITGLTIELPTGRPKPV
jgi:hypothetical protein